MKLQAIYRRLQLDSGAEKDLLPPPTDSSLQEYETETNFILPSDYKRFVKRYGVGELAGYYRFYAPLDCTVPGAERYDLAAFNRLARERPAKLQSYHQPSIVDDLVIFCSTIGGAWYAWNKTEVHSSGTHEYAICELDSALRVASVAFADFVTKCCQREFWSDEVKEEDWSYSRFRRRK